MHIKKRRGKPAVVFAVCVIVIATAVLIMVGIRAKYMTSVPLSGTVTFKADLADNVTLTEHQAIRNADGSYSLSTDTTNLNTYVVMPGVDIPKDPYFTITNKSSIDAYLYVEIDDNSPDTVTYKLAEGWKELGIEGRKVYVYNGSISQEGSQTIQILENNMVSVSDKYDPTSKNFNLKFYGYMAQKENEKTAEDIFNKNY